MKIIKKKNVILFDGIDEPDQTLLEQLLIYRINRARGFRGDRYPRRSAAWQWSYSKVIYIYR